MKSRFSLLLGCMLAVPLAAQDAQDVLALARAQLQTRNLDSAAALLRRITDSTSWNDSLRRIDAFVLLGIVRYYQGSDSTSRAAFGAALMLNPALPAPPLAQLDSTLGALFASARDAAAAPALDTLYSCVPRCQGLESGPTPVDAEQKVPFVVSGPRISGGHGSALLRAIVDTLGQVEPGSVQVVYSTLPLETERSAVEGLRATRFHPGQAHGHAVRVLIERRIEITPAPH